MIKCCYIRDRAEIEATWNQLNDLDMPIVEKGKEMRTLLAVMKVLLLISKRLFCVV